jgi:redox-sensitive bicupin YhaK (pirin superfamily)
MDIIPGRSRDLGGFAVRRVLPIGHRKTVGPFIFLDHMGPLALPPGQGIDVRPHPHIGLATVTYLFEGRLVHRDSLGILQTIEPGAVNWMIAGRGIAHAERSPADDRRHGLRLHGIQSWVALPKEAEEMEPSFAHHPGETLPEVRRPGVRLRIIAGRAYGALSPAHTLSPMFYVDAELEAGARLSLPIEYEERAIYPVDCAIELEGQRYEAGQLLVLEAAREALLTAPDGGRVMLLGGAPLDGERHIWWNFVSSRPERIDQAKAEWVTRTFPQVRGDPEYIPLPRA